MELDPKDEERAMVTTSPHPSVLSLESSPLGLLRTRLAIFRKGPFISGNAVLTQIGLGVLQHVVLVLPLQAWSMGRAVGRPVITGGGIPGDVGLGGMDRGRCMGFSSGMAYDIRRSHGRCCKY